MTIQEYFLQTNLQKAEGSQKYDMLISTNLLLALAETPALTLDQLYLILLGTPGEMNKLLDMMLVDNWKYLDVYPAMKTRLDEIVLYREQLRGLMPAKAVTPDPLDLGDVNVAGLFGLWKGCPENARLASVKSSLLLRGSEVATNQFEEFRHELTHFLTISDLYDYLMEIWPEKRFPIRTFNTSFTEDTNATPSSWVFQIAVGLRIQDAIENQSYTAVLCTAP